MEREDANIVDLDVRPHLRKKLEPFQLIMDAVKMLDKDDIFKLHSTFKPTPLFGVLKMKGFAGKAEYVGKEHWISTFVNKKNRHWLNEAGDVEELPAEEPDVDASTPTDDGTPSADGGTPPADDGMTATSGPKTIALDNRGLEPPQPMIRTLTALERCRPGDEVAIHNDRVPVFLLEELRNLGYPYTIEEQPDGSAKVSIRKT